MTDLFHFPPQLQPAAPIVARAPTVMQALSERVNVPSPRTRKLVEYARLSDAHHREVRSMIRALWDCRADIRAVLDRPSGLYGVSGVFRPRP